MSVKRSTTVRDMQKLCGFLNFLCCCIVPGRAFTRRLYANFSSKMKSHHHIWVTSEIRADLTMWLKFLKNPVVFCHPFIDFSTILMASSIDWYTDASGVIGFGGYCNKDWFQAKWGAFLNQHPSIEYQELFTVTVLILLWGHKFANSRICLYCENQAVVAMINNSTSSCRNCMKLIRIITLKSLECNVRVFVHYVRTDDNSFADALSRFQMQRFWTLAQDTEKIFNDKPVALPEEVWPINNNVWFF